MLTDQIYVKHQTKQNQNISIKHQINHQNISVSFIFLLFRWALKSMASQKFLGLSKDAKGAKFEAIVNEPPNDREGTFGMILFRFNLLYFNPILHRLRKGLFRSVAK